MNRLVVALFLCSINAVGWAQQSGTVTGVVVDSGSGRPLPLVTVSFADAATGAEIAGTLTDETGRFVVNGLPRGEYLVRPAFIGYERTETAVLIGTLNDAYDLGEIALNESAEALEEVVATARQQVLGASIDRRVFNVGDAIAQSQGSVMDAMRGMPGVTVDQDGRVLLRGSDRVAVLVDGNQSGLTGIGNQAGLDSIPASSIESIEIINNPSARYDAAGMAGIINIVFKKDDEAGTHMEAGFAAGVGQLSKRRGDLPTELGSFSRNPRLNPSFNLAHNGTDGGFFFRSNFLVQEDIPNNEFTSRYYDDGRVVFSQVPENRKQEHYIFSGGFDRYIDADRTLSFSSVLDFETHKDVAQVPFIDATTMQRNRYWFWEENEDTGFFNAAVNYERQFAEPGREIRFNVQYTRGWEDEAYYLNEESAVRIGTDATHLVAKEHTLPFTVDYTKPLRSGRLEAGSRLQRRWIPITYDVERGVGSVIYPGLGDESEWRESIYAGYLNYVHEKPRYDVEAGLRIEQTDVSYDLPAGNIYYDESDAYDYFEAYPNVRLTYNVDDRNSIAAHYNNRVDRPGEPELRVFPKYDDPELLKVGNPYLRPQFTETFELVYEHVWDRASVILSAYQRNIDDPFTRVFAIDPSNTNYDIVNRVYQNVGSGTNTGLEMLFTKDAGEFWELSGSVNWYDNVIDAAETTLLFPFPRPFSVPETKDNTWDLKLNGLFEAPGGFRLQLSLVYYAEKNIAQGRQDARSSVDIGASQPVMAGRGELVFSVTDLLNDFGIRQFIDGDGFDAIYENFYQTQVATIGLNYQF